MFDNLTTPQRWGAAIVIAAILGLIALAFVFAAHVGRIASGPVPVGPDGTLEATRRWQDSAAGVRPSYLPAEQPEPEPEQVGGRHRRYPDAVPEETRPVEVAGVPDPGDMSRVDAAFRDVFANRPASRAWEETNRRREALQARLLDPDRTDLLPPVTSRRGAA